MSSMLLFCHANLRSYLLLVEFFLQSDLAFFILVSVCQTAHTHHYPAHMWPARDSYHGSARRYDAVFSFLYLPVSPSTECWHRLQLLKKDIYKRTLVFVTIYRPFLKQEIARSKLAIGVGWPNCSNYRISWQNVQRFEQDVGKLVPLPLLDCQSHVNYKLLNIGVDYQGCVKVFTILRIYTRTKVRNILNALQPFM